MQLKYSNYVAFSHFHGKAVNNSGLVVEKKNTGYNIKKEEKFSRNFVKTKK